MIAHLHSSQVYCCKVVAFEDFQKVGIVKPDLRLRFRRRLFQKAYIFGIRILVSVFKVGVKFSVQA
jgi:hypothetical protein